MKTLFIILALTLVGCGEDNARVASEVAYQALAHPTKDCPNGEDQNNNCNP